MEKGSDAALEKKLDRREYNDDELISIKTKLNLPYYSSSRNFERTYGSVNIDGIVYEYVKQRVYNDTLELLCLPNTAKTDLQNAGNELAKASAEGQASVPVKKGPSTLKISLPNFFQPLFTFISVSTPVKKEYIVQNEPFTFFTFGKRQERPPQTMDLFS
jgi:hypothetical protein